MIVMADKRNDDEMEIVSRGLQQRVENVLDQITAKVDEIRAILTEEQHDDSNE